MNMPNVERIERIECTECGAWAYGWQLTQADIELVNELQRCSACSADIEALQIDIN